VTFRSHFWLKHPGTFELNAKLKTIERPGRMEPVVCVNRNSLRGVGSRPAGWKKLFERRQSKGWTTSGHVTGAILLIGDFVLLSPTRSSMSLAIFYRK
jgi:hypothetical protein